MKTTKFARGKCAQQIEIFSLTHIKHFHTFRHHAYHRMADDRHVDLLFEIIIIGRACRRLEGVGKLLLHRPNSANSYDTV